MMTATINNSKKHCKVCDDGQLVFIGLKGVNGKFSCSVCGKDHKIVHYNQGQKPKSNMPKLQKVEASLQTKGRFRDGSGKYIFCIYEEFSNETIYESAVYVSRSNAKRGAIRYAKRNQMKITLWVK